MDIPKKIGRYEILQEIGRGAMGTVYRAKDPAIDRVVALKTIISAALASQQGSEFRERFYREARAAGALSHPGIVTVYDVGEHDGMPFLVMEFVTGRTLADVIEKGERLRPDRVCEIGQKIAEALGYAHQHGTVHRDIKPANILLTSGATYGIERPKITDFGVAKLVEEHATLTGQILGTPAFMSPEQFTGTPIDGRTDIFSLGVVLYLMSTGEQPFPGEGITAVSYKAVHTDPVPPRRLNPSLPPKLESVILTCLAKNPAERYQTGEELARDLGQLGPANKAATLQVTLPQRVAAGDDPDATVIELTPKATAGASAPTQQPGRAAAPKGSRGHRFVLAAVIAAVAAAGGGYALWSWQKSAAPAVAPPPPAAMSAASVPAPAVTQAPRRVVGAAEPAPEASPGKEASTTSRPGAGAPEKKPDASAESKVSAVSPPKVAKAAREPAALGFDPKALDRRQNASLKIDAARVPPGLDFSVEMNGKLYLRKTGAGAYAQEGDLYVPPGVHEFRVTAKSGVVEKTSNTVSTEFKARKRSTLKIELRIQGMPAEAGIPQGLYPGAQIVVTLK